MALGIEQKKAKVLENIHALRDNYISQLRTLLQLEWAIRRKEQGAATIYEVEKLKREVNRDYKEAISVLIQEEL